MDYLKSMLENELALHICYSNLEDRTYSFQNIWLANAVKQHGIEKCREEINTNLQNILERTYKNYQMLDKRSQNNSKDFIKQLRILEKILSEKRKNKIVIFGMDEKEKIETYFFF